MNITRQQTDLAGELIWWKQETVFSLALFVGLISYLWLAWALLPLNTIAPGTLAALIILSGTAMLVLWLRHRNLDLAVQILVWGSLVALACTEVTTTGLLIILPVLLANALLGLRSVALVTAASYILTLFTSTLRHESPIHALALLSIAVVTIQLAMRHLRVALGIIWTNYLRAYQDQALLREKQGELRHIVKQLDEATFEASRLRHQLTLAYSQAHTA